MVILSKISVEILYKKSKENKNILAYITVMREIYCNLLGNGV